MTFQLGLDTGGTYTDAVLINDEQQVIACAKSLTTHHNLIEGLRGAALQVLDKVHQPITLVSLSTTLATNALVEGRGRPICLILIGYRPEQLKRANLVSALGGDPHFFISGGHTASGAAVCALDRQALQHAVESVASSVDAFAVSSVFAVRNPEHELQARDLIMRLTGLPVTCGHSLSSGLDAPRRALTSLLNARLIPLITALLEASDVLLKEQQIDAPLMVVKGDGSLVSAKFAQASPVETILSGPAASVVGAQFLCKESVVLVSDMGGTTTDVAMIRDGQPELSADGATVGGWRTMVKAIDVKTFGLGGDSRIRYDREPRQFTVGPERVMSISLLCQRHPELKAVLQAQLELPFSTTHSAEFVFAQAAAPANLTLQQRELWDMIEGKPLAVQTLFEDQTLDRALTRLIHTGVVMRAGFTPSDACHILGVQSDWDVEAAELAAQLLMRYSAQNLGKRYVSSTEFAQEQVDSVSRLSALALVDTVSSQIIKKTSKFSQGLSESQRELLASTFVDSPDAALQLRATLGFPVVGLGAPAGSYYPKSAQWLNCHVVLPEFGHVANALGAVVGVVRQSQNILITPAGGKRVNVHFLEGTQSYDSLEEAATLAIEWACAKATELASDAGAGYISVSHTRVDNIVDNKGEQVFFESCIVATAVGRPIGTMK